MLLDNDLGVRELLKGFFLEGNQSLSQVCLQKLFKFPTLLTNACQVFLGDRFSEEKYFNSLLQGLLELGIEEIIMEFTNRLIVLGKSGNYI